MTDAKMKECCQQMKEQKEKMQAEMKSQDAALTAQVAAMNSAPPEQKVSLMAAIVTVMAEQRVARDAQMEKMHGEMMLHMMKHMQMCKDGSPQCPMTKDMDGKPEEMK